MFVITPSNYIFNMGAFIVCKLYLSSDFFRLLELFSCVPWLMASSSIFKVNSVLLQSTTLFFCLNFPLHPYLLGGYPLRHVGSQFPDQRSNIYTHPPAFETQGLNYWTTREIPPVSLFLIFFNMYLFLTVLGLIYSIGPCFYHQSHPQLGFGFAWLRPFVLSEVISPLISRSILGTY